MKTIKKNIPIKLDALYQTTSIFISLDVSVEKPGVLYNKYNAVYYDGKILFAGDAVPNDLKIVNKGQELKGKKFRLFSRYNVIAPTDDEPVFPVVNWKPNLEAGDDTIYDEPESVKSDDNMFEFILTFEFS
jgi:hypothetical protein